MNDFDTQDTTQEEVVTPTPIVTPVVETPVQTEVEHTITFTDSTIDRLFGHGEIRRVVDKIITDLKAL